MNYNFITKRMIVKEWHSFEPNELDQPDLEEIVEEILIPEVTKSFSFMWQGAYTKKRTQAWIKEQDSQAKTLLAVEKESKKAIGCINFFTVRNMGKTIELRIGYYLSKPLWGKGYATELVEGFLHWCKKNNIATVATEVAPDNIASIRVLQKNNFSIQTTKPNVMSLLFVYDLAKEEAQKQLLALKPKRYNTL